MLKNKLIVFAIKRVLFFYPFVLIVCLIFTTGKISSSIGLTIGAVLSLLRLSLSTEVMNKLNAPIVKEHVGNQHSTPRLVVLQLVNQFLILPLLFVAFMINKSFFAGFIVGVLIVPFVFMINSITEAIGLTHNNFE